MDKRLLKRHKRQVARAKAHVKLSEPDLRTPEQLRAAREASRPDSSRSNNSNMRYAAQSPHSQIGPSADSRAKGDG